jgi:DNA-binding winged helix-turn-helix (wHTH) protein/TolB-like protein/Tfp pilus assembly protein PilF
MQLTGSAGPREGFRFGVFDLDLQAGELRKRGIRLKLHGQSFQLLTALLERPREVVTREELRNRLWPSGAYVDFDHSLANAINKIREVLGDSVESPRFIETLPRRGYRFIAPVEKLDNTASQPAAPPPNKNTHADSVPAAAQGSAFLTTQASPWLTARARFLAIVLAASVAVMACWLTYSRPDLFRKNPRSQTISIAVLPFADLTPRKDQSFLCDGIVDEIRKALSGVAGVSVVSGTQSFPIRSRDEYIRRIAREMNIRAAVAGNVQVASEGIRITAELLSGVDGHQLWSETYQRQRGDVRAIRHEIARVISTALEARLVSGRDKLLRASSADVETYNLYQRARYGPRLTSDSIPYFEQALARDPHFALAQAGLASAYISLALNAEVSPREAMPKAKMAALKALDIDDGLAEAHLDLGIVKATYDWDRTGAGREFRRALELNPNVEAGHATYALYLAYMGRFDEAMDQMPDVEPTPIGLATLHASIYYFSRQYQRTIEYCRWVLTFAPGADGIQFWLGRAYADQSRLTEAIDLLERARSTNQRKGNGFGMLASLYARAGRRADALRLLTGAIKLSKTQYVSPVSVAIIYIELKDFDRSFEWLDKACDERDFSMSSLRVEPVYDPLRTDPRFKRLLHRVNLE